MPFGIFLGLKLKPAASEHFPLPPLPRVPHFLSSLFLNPEGEGCPLTCSTEPDNLSSIDSSHKSFRNTILMGSVCVVGVVITKQLISWYADGFQNTEVFTKRCSNANQFLRGNETRHEVCWGNLPLEVWGEVGKRMVSRLDIITFRSVCTQWRSSLPSPTGRFPLVLPPPPSCDPEFRDISYAISELNIYRSIGGKPLMQVDQGGIFTLNIELSLWGDKENFEQESLKAPVCHLKTFMSLWEDKVDYHNETLMRSTLLAFSEITFFAKALYPCMALDSHQIRQCNGFPKKLALISSSNADGVNPNYAKMSDLSVVALLGGGMKGRLALLRLGGSPEHWAWDTDFCAQVFVNIATYKGKLCTIDHCGRVCLMDYNSLQLTQVCAPLPPFELEGKSLFECRGDLYLVDFKFNTRFDVVAYKLSLQLQTWLKVERMGRPYFGVVAPFLL